MRKHLDRDGQPLNLAFNAERRLDRAVHELLGLVKGVLADGVVTDAEIVAVSRWLKAQPDLAEQWPISILANRIRRIFEDRYVDSEERRDLQDLFERLVGGNYGIAAGDNLATRLPLDDPPPPVLFDSRTFVFTGKFAFGPRSVCERMVRENGGRCQDWISERVDYVVVGTFASRDWIHTSYGRKIEEAVAYRDRGAPIKIVGEDHWAAALP